MNFEPTILESRGGERATAEFGRLDVPERRDRPGARSIHIACLRLSRTTPTPHPPVVFLAGGPGESAIAAASGRFFGAFQQLREVTDVIALDVRGVGRSEPVPPYVEVEPAPDVFASRDTLLAHLCEEGRRTVTACRERGFDLGGYHAVEMARDLRDLRDALGTDAFTLWGYSFGSHLATAAARYHPDIVAALIFCGVEGPNHTHKLPANVDGHLERLAALVHNADIGVPDLVALMHDVHAHLDRDRPEVTMTLAPGSPPARYRIGAFAAQYATWRTMTDRRAYRFVPAQYARAARGDFEPLARSIEAQWHRRPRTPVFYLSDGASGATADRLAAIRLQASACALADAASFPFPMIDATYEALDLGDSFREPPAFDGPTLMLSGSLDSNTPPHQAEALLGGFPRGSHVVVENAAHNELISTPEEAALLHAFVTGNPLPPGHIAAPVPGFVTP